VKLYHALHVHEYGGSPSIFRDVWQYIFGNEVDNLHWSNWIPCASMGSKVVQASRFGSAYMIFFTSLLFSFLIIIHLSHASNCHSSIAPLYVVYAGCQCVWWLATVVTWLGESIEIWPLWYQQISFLDGEVRSESSICSHNKQWWRTEGGDWMGGWTRAESNYFARTGHVLSSNPKAKNLQKGDEHTNQ
jgi:hypothetical protein